MAQLWLIDLLTSSSMAWYSRLGSLNPSTFPSEPAPPPKVTPVRVLPAEFTQEAALTPAKQALPTLCPNVSCSLRTKAFVARPLASIHAAGKPRFLRAVSLAAVGLAQVAV